MTSKNFEKAVTGFNHNIKHKGKVYHVQTEDSGINNPHIITHLFVGGNILASKKTSYADILNAENLPEVVRELMEEQHKEMLRNLINGVYDNVDAGGGAKHYQPGQLGTEEDARRARGHTGERPALQAQLPPEVLAARACTRYTARLITGGAMPGPSTAEAQGEVQRLQQISHKLRIDIIETIAKAGSGHPGGSLSAIDVITCLYFSRMKLDPKRPDWPERDRFVLSKGHAVPAQYVAMAEAGYFSHDQIGRAHV